jgi:hypothetical protein
MRKVLQGEMSRDVLAAELGQMEAGDWRVVYKRSDLTADERHACCAARMFLTDGEGVVFRGAIGPWYHTDTKQFHLDATAAENLREWS